MTEKKHILSILVDNEPGVLSRIAGLFSGRGYNIESLCVAETTDAMISRITMVTQGDSMILEQIKKQLNKLINVIKVADLTGQDYVERELVLIKINAKPEHRAEILRINGYFQGPGGGRGSGTLHHQRYRRLEQDQRHFQPVKTIRH